MDPMKFQCFQFLAYPIARPKSNENRRKTSAKGKRQKNLRIFATIDLFRGYVAAFCFDNELFKRPRCLATV